MEKYSQIAVIDIGSNSIRLVFFYGNQQFIIPFFNEKLACALGQSVSKTGEISSDHMHAATDVLKRFKKLIEDAGITKMRAIATAAVRDAKNGKTFQKKATDILGAPVEILTGEEEAKYGALAVQVGVCNASGLVGDLGGGSLDISTIGVKGDMASSFRLGSLSLIARSDGEISKAEKVVQDDFSDDKKMFKDFETFYAIGGSWRALATLHMACNDYPLRVVHGYILKREALLDFLNQLIKGKISDDEIKQHVSQSRRDLIGFAAVVLKYIVELGKFKQVYFISNGIREAIAYELLPKVKHKESQILGFSRFLCSNLYPEFHHEDSLNVMQDWILAHMKILSDDLSFLDENLITAAVQLSLISWWSHPEYRSTIQQNMASLGPYIGVSHFDRSFLAVAMHHRYEGVKADLSPNLESFTDLIGDEAYDSARLLASLIRLALVLAPVKRQSLSLFWLVKEKDEIVLTIPKTEKNIICLRVEKRLDKVAECLNVTSKIDVIER